MRFLTIAILSIFMAAILYGAEPPNPVKFNIAVMDLEGRQGLTPDEMLVISEVLRGELVKTEKFTVLDRKDMESILQEQDFQKSDVCDKTSCIVEIGKLLAVHKMVGGTINRVGGMYAVDVKIIDIQTGAIDKQVSEDVRSTKESLISNYIPKVARRLAGLESGGKKPWFAQWYFWVPTAVVVGGGAAAAIVLSQSKSGSNADNNGPVGGRDSTFNFDIIIEPAP